MMKAINRSSTNPDWDANEYTEKHHWYPKSLHPSWSNCDWNIIKLKPREHFIAHWLLAKWLGGKMSHAFIMMCSTDPSNGERHVPTSSAYTSAKRLKSESMKGSKASNSTKNKMSLSRTGSKNPMYGRSGIDAPGFGVRGKSHKSSKGTVKGTNIKTGEVIIIDGSFEMSKLGFDKSCISACVLGKRKSHKGFKWIRNKIEDK